MTAALGGGELSAACPGRTLPPGKTGYHLYRRLGGPQGRSIYYIIKVYAHSKTLPKIVAFSGQAITFVWTHDVSCGHYESQSSTLRSCLASVSQAPVLTCQTLSLSTSSVEYNFYCKVTGPRNVNYLCTRVHWDIRNPPCALLST